MLNAAEKEHLEELVCASKYYSCTCSGTIPKLRVSLCCKFRVLQRWERRDFKPRWSTHHIRG
jgi:hypothetical protein